MFKFYVFSTDKDSFVVPQEKFKCKKFVYRWEIEGDVKICDKRIKLPRYISKIEEIDNLIGNLIRIKENNDEEPKTE
jgi:hypothetical protein